MAFVRTVCIITVLLLGWAALRAEGLAQTMHRVGHPVADQAAP